MKSTSPSMPAMRSVETRTTLVEAIASSLLGHVTFLKEQDDSCHFLRPSALPIPVQARQDSNPQHPVLETGALPLELLAYGSCRPSRHPTPRPTRLRVIWRGRLRPTPPSLARPYFTFASLWSVCFLSHRQYLLNSSFPWVFLRFFVVV